MIDPPSDPTKAEAQRREKRIASKMNRCVHFSGVQHATCDVGVKYETVREAMTALSPPRFACFVDERHGLTCEKAQFLTREEAERQETEDEAATQRTLSALRAAHADAKVKGYGKGLKAGVDTCACPVCGGVLRYSVARYNGHMHARCETAGCVSWME